MRLLWEGSPRPEKSRPTALSCRGRKQLLEAREEAFSRPADGAEALEVGGFLLAVNEGDAEGEEGLYEEDEGQFGGIGGGGEHAFAEEDIPQADAIEAPHQRPFQEGFHAVCEAEVVQGDIGFLHFLS